MSACRLLPCDPMLPGRGYGYGDYAKLLLTLGSLHTPFIRSDYEESAQHYISLWFATAGCDAVSPEDGLPLRGRWYTK
jgi:hypothetical protein